MTTITNSSGHEYDVSQWDAIVHTMDDELRELLHNALAPCSEQEFFDAYAKAHKAKFNETWELDKVTPQW